MIKMHPRQRTYRIFGPKIRQPTWHSAPLQRGSGFGSFFAKMGRKLMPLVKKAIPLTKNVVKKIASSKSVQDIGNSLLEKGLETAATIAGNVIAGDKEVDNLALAQERLQSAREDIASIIRKAPKRVISETDEDSDEISIPIKKKKKKKTVKVAKTKKKYNLLKNIA